jgi:hypothetical protein
MIFFKRSFILLGLMACCTIVSGCALIQLPFQMLGAAVGVAGSAAGTAAQVGMAAAPYAPLFL